MRIPLPRPADLIAQPLLGSLALLEVTLLLTADALRPGAAPRGPTAPSIRTTTTSSAPASSPTNAYTCVDFSPPTVDDCSATSAVCATSSTCPSDPPRRQGPARATPSGYLHRWAPPSQRPSFFVIDTPSNNVITLKPRAAEPQRSLTSAI